MEFTHNEAELRKAAKIFDSLDDMRPQLSRLNTIAVELADYMQPYDWHNFAALVEIYDIDSPLQILERLIIIFTWRKHHTT